MWPDRVSIPGPLTNESGALPIALRGPAVDLVKVYSYMYVACILFPQSTWFKPLCSNVSPANFVSCYLKKKKQKKKQNVDKIYV